MAIKKAFTDIVAFLEANQGAKVKTILPAVIELCSAKAGGAGGEAKFIRDADGVLTHIFCYYHKMWEPVNPDGSASDGMCEYGKKANTATGLNSMCKEGTSAWTTQNRAAKNANQDLLKAVSVGDVAPEDILIEQEKIEDTRSLVSARGDGLGTTARPVTVVATATDTEAA